MVSYLVLNLYGYDHSLIAFYEITNLPDIILLKWGCWLKFQLKSVLPPDWTSLPTDIYCPHIRSDQTFCQNFEYMSASQSYIGAFLGADLSALGSNICRDMLGSWLIIISKTHFFLIGNYVLGKHPALKPNTYWIIVNSLIPTLSKKT